VTETRTTDTERVENSPPEQLIIVGGGPAGYTAALYAARAELEPLVIEGFQWGGQLQNTTHVENYPGYQEGVMGPEMMNDFRAQAERFGARFITDDATELELTSGELQTVRVGKDTYQARAVILSMGAEPKRLGIPGEVELGGRGVSTCGVCDGAFFKGEDVVVIGGGDSAMEDSIFVSKFAKGLTIVHRRDEFRASKIMEQRARGKENIEFLTPYVPVEFVAGDDGKIAKVRVQHAETGEETELEAGGAFVAIGHKPRSELVEGQVELDDEGYVVVDEPSTKTNLAGVFAVGDLVDHTYRQAVTAAGSGTKGALDAEWYLRDMAPDPEEHWGTNTGAIIEAVEAT
jgi:thioredoxin reductase (NADPH)